MGLTRRLFLGRSSCIALAGSIPAAAIATASQPEAFVVEPLAAALAAGRNTESPELLALGADIPAMLKRYAEASDALDLAEDLALAADIPPPDDLRVPHHHPLLGGMGWSFLSRETNILGDERPPEKLPDGRYRDFRVATSGDVERRGRTFVGLYPKGHAELDRLHAIALRYEQAREQIRQANGLDEARVEKYRAGQALADMCRAARDMQARTVVGILIKAQAIAASLKVEDESGRAAAFYASAPLASSVCEVLGGAA